MTVYREMWNSAGTIFAREMHLRYRRTLLGVVWVAVPTLVGGFSFFFIGQQLGLHDGTSELSSPVGTFLKVTVLQFFVECMNAPLQMTNRSRNFLRSIPVRYESLALAGLLFATLNLAVRIGMFVPICFIFQFVPEPLHIIGFFLLLPFVGFFGLGLGLLITPMSLVYWDVRYAYGYLIGIATFLTPLFYTAGNDTLLSAITFYNPLTHLFMETTRTFFGIGILHWGPLAISAGIGLILFFLGVRYFKHAMPIAIEMI
jgi:lipopolysaccharide transport system permease protein